eukprot:469645_1
MSNRILNRSYRQNQFQQRTHLRYKRHKIQFFFLPAALINNIHSFLLSITYIPNLPWNQTANIHAETVKNVNKLFWYNNNRGAPHSNAPTAIPVEAAVPAKPTKC